MDSAQAEKIRKHLLEQISKLPSDQAGQLRGQIERATPEQIEQMISSQKSAGSGECLFCTIASGKIETLKVFDDENIFIMMDINPANLGHVIIIPKQHYQFIFQVPDEVLWYMIKVAKLITPILINIVKARGVNIHIAQGPAAEQRVEHFAINIIPRFEEDNISFDWERKQMADEQKDVMKKLSENFPKLVDELKKTQVTKKEEKKEEKEEKQAEKLLYFPRRMP